MSLNAAVQHMAAGAAAFVAGQIVGADEASPLTGFEVIGLVGGVATAASILLAGRLRPARDGDVAPDAAEISRASRAPAVVE
jgi:hypothetical protein